MKTKAQLQIETQTPIEINPDSIYQPIERPEKKFSKLQVSRTLEAALPFASKPKVQTKRKKKSYISKRAVSGKKTKYDCQSCILSFFSPLIKVIFFQRRNISQVVMDASEKKKYSFIQAVNTIRNDKVIKRKQKNAERFAEKEKKNAKNEEKFAAIRKANKKREYRAEGKRDAVRMAKKLRGE